MVSSDVSCIPFCPGKTTSHYYKIDRLVLTPDDHQTRNNNLQAGPVKKLLQPTTQISACRTQQVSLATDFLKAKAHSIFLLGKNTPPQGPTRQ